MKVLLVSANLERNPRPVFPIGMSYVGRALEPEHEVRLFDCIVDGEENLPAAVAAFAPDLVGMSLRNVDDTRPSGHAHVGNYQRIAARIRSATSAPLVLGGAAYTLFPERYVAELGADYGIAGEGEHLRLLVDALAAGIDPDQADGGRGVPGLVRPGRAPVPPRPWTGGKGHAAASHRLAQEYTLVGGSMNLQTKRGCCMDCVYCTYPVVEGRKLRNHEVDALVDEVERLVRNGSPYLFFVDSVFNLDLNHTARVAEEMIRRNVVVPWAGCFAPYRMPRDYAKLLRASGLTHAEFGTESLCDSVLEAYGKPFHVDDIIEAHESLGEAGVHRAHFLLFAGPGETEATIEETLATSRRLRDTVYMPFSTMRIYPHTPLHQLAVAEGVLSPSNDLFEPVFYCSKDVRPEWLDERLKREARERTNFLLEDTIAASTAIVARLHKKGIFGPGWEFRIR